MDNPAFCGPVKTLPSNHMAILFQGTWLLTPDPDDEDRILATCPYVNAPDHTCYVGVWRDGLLQGPSSDTPVEMQEGNHFRVDVSSDLETQKTVAEILSEGHMAHSFPYLQPTTGDPALVSTTPKMRSVSISKPARVVADGRSDATVMEPDTDGLISASRTGELHSFTNLIMVYLFDISASMTLGNSFLSTEVMTQDSPDRHLIFRVLPDDDDSEMHSDDCAEENAHVSGSFNMLRKLVNLPSGLPAPRPSRLFCDVGLYPIPGQEMSFCNEFTNFTRDELGVPPWPLVAHVRGMTSCATGPIVSDPGGGGGGPLVSEKKG